MAIPDEDVLAVRSATDMAALVGEYTPLKRVGRRFVGLCPFHSEKSGSFSVNTEEGLYYCFGCQASGDAITFLRAIEALSFVEAVERLAARAGIAIRNDAGGPDREARDRRQALYDAMEKAVAFYHERLLRHPDAAKARQYLRSRGLDSETVRRFKLGYAPEGGSQLVRGVTSSAAALVGAGLAIQGNYGPRDAFRGRVIFPIFLPDGKAVALGGRLVPGVGNGEGPKYRNSPETPIYQKRSTLYGLHLSRQDVVKSGEVIVCEGYTDVIGLFRVGLPRAVATCGTALTEDHFKLLARFGRRIVLAFDADGAGQSAAARFYEWERRHELEVAVADLPPDSDPGELASSDPDRLRAVVEGARTYLEFRLRRALAGEELRTPEGRARAAEAAIAVVAEHPHELVRDQYLVEVADRTRLEVERLRPLLAEALRKAEAATRRAVTTGTNAGRSGAPGAAAGGRATGGRDAPARGNGRPDDAPPLTDEDAPPEYDDWGDRPAGPRAGPGGGRRQAAQTSPSGPGRTGARPAGGAAGHRAGRDALALAIHEPAEMAARLGEHLFIDPLQRRAYRALASASSLHDAIDHADDDVAHLLVELANSDPGIGADQAIVALVRTTAQAALAELQSEIREAQASGNHDRLLELAPIVAWLKSELEVFSDVGAGDHPPAHVIEAADRLVAWLSMRRGEAA